MFDEFLMNFFPIFPTICHFHLFLQCHANIKKISLNCALLCKELEIFTGVDMEKQGRYQHIFVQGEGGIWNFCQKYFPLEITYMLSQCHSLQFCNILSEKISILMCAPSGGEGGVLPCPNF